MSPATRTHSAPRRPRGTATRSRGRAPAARAGWQRHRPPKSAQPSGWNRAKSVHKRAKAARTAWRKHPVARARARYKRIPHRRRGAAWACLGAVLAIGALTALAIEGTALTIAAEASWVGTGISAGISAWEWRQERKWRAANPAPPVPPKPRAPKVKPPSQLKRAPNCPCQCRNHGRPANGSTCNCICGAQAGQAKQSSNGRPAGPRSKAGPPPSRVP